MQVALRGVGADLLAGTAAGRRRSTPSATIRSPSRPASWTIAPTTASSAVCERPPEMKDLSSLTMFSGSARSVLSAE